MTKKKPMRAQDIMEAMSKRWTDPEWAIMWEVAEGTGAGAGRRADAVMMSLWPSRGLELHGVEIKVSRSDWKREAADPTKAEAVAKFCDRWWIHTPKGIVDDISDLPPAWGLREFDGRCWRTVKDAEKTEAAPITRLFLASLLRRADGTMQRLVRDAVDEARAAEFAEAEERRRRFHETVKTEVERRTSGFGQIEENLAEFEEAFGKGSIRDWGVDRAALGRAALALHHCRQGSFGKGSLVERLRAAADAIEAVQSLVEPEKVES
ncbi:MAG: hypothetical protein AAF675_20305 [Pseudomonadota bacterium]